MASRRDTRTGGGIGFETQKLVLGQRIAVETDPTSTEALAEALDALTRITGDPLDVLGSLFGSGAGAARQGYRYDPARKWLVGADLSMRGLGLRLLLADTSFYGIGITFSAPKEEDGDEKDENRNENRDDDGDERQSSFDGLALEVLYRRINEHLGVFSADLTLPKRYRQLEMGTAKVTLPAVGLEIFTNSDFKVSIGWPLGDRSLAIQLEPDPIPWAGGGGLYFAKLRSEDAPGALGTDFDPILELGIGLRIGAATDGDVSIIEYDASLYLFGTFEGFLAWKGGSFADGLDYYWFSATVGITGHLEGRVDFEIVKASVSLDLTASASLALETDHRTQASVRFEVKATAKVKVLFVTIHFSFGLTLTESFVFGPGGHPVARISGPTPDARSPRLVTGSARVAETAPGAAPRRTLYSPALEALADAGARGPTFAARSDRAFPRATRVAAATDRPDLTLLFLAQPTVLGGAGGTWQPGAVASLVASRAAPGEASGEDTFCQLVQGIAHWLYDERSDHDDGLEARLAQVSAAIAGDGFGLDQVLQCLEDRFTFTIAGHAPDGDQGGEQGGEQKEIDGALLPLFPTLVVSHGGAPTPFPGAPTPAGYAERLAAYFDQLRIETSHRAATAGATAAAGEGPPPGALVFADFYALLARQLFHELEGIAELSRAGTLEEALTDLSYDNLAGMVSRYLVNGMRLPSPAGALVGLAALTGQQVTLAGEHASPTLSLSLASGAGGPRIGFAGAADSASTDLHAVLSTGPTRGPLWKPAALAPLIESPMRLLLPAGTPWSAPQGDRQLLRIPGPLGGIARGRGGAALELAALDERGERGERLAATPALLARFSLGRVADPSDPGKHVDHVYQVFGTDEETRERLFAVLEDGAAVTLDLLLPGDPGFATASRASALLVKTNLSTLHEPPPVMAAQAPRARPDIGPVHATLADAEEFLRIVWEVSVVHAGGYFLHLPDLAASRFASAERVDVALLASFAAHPVVEIDVGEMTDIDLTEFGALEGDPPDSDAVEIDARHNVLVIEAEHVAAGTRVDAGVLDRATRKPLPSYRPSHPAGCVGFGALWNDPPAEVADDGDPATLASALYHLLQYRIVEGGGYRASPWSLPVGPNSHAAGRADEGVEGAAWRYRQAFPPHRFLDGAQSLPANPYAAIGKPVTVAFQLLDIYGNAIDADVLGAEGLPTLELTPTYNDRLIAPGEWPGVGIGYVLRPGESDRVELLLEIAFDPSAVLGPSPVTRPSPAAKQALRTFEAVHAQLTDPNVEVTLATSLAPAPVTVHTRSGSDLARGLATLLTAVCKHLSHFTESGVQVEPPPIKPITLVGAIGRGHVATLPNDLVPVDVTLGIRRKVCVGPDGGAPPSPQICAIEHTVPAELELADQLGSAHGGESDATPRRAALHGFAQLFESAYADFAPGARLKLLEGRQAQQRRPGRLWALRWGAGAGIDVTFPNAAGHAGDDVTGEPVYFALPPLSTRLEEGTFPVRAYREDGAPEAPAQRSFSRVDLDAWARDFLRAVDALLEPRSAAAIAAIDGEAHESLMAAKDTLAGAISGGLAHVLSAQAGAGDAEAARERLEQTLLARLSDAWSTSAVVQMPVTVAAQSTEVEPRAPELYGDVAPRSAPMPFAPMPSAPMPSAPMSASGAHQFTVSPAALPVEPGSGHLTFLASALHPSAQASLDLDLDYRVAFLDHRFETDESRYGYVPSSWLRFALPEGPGRSAPVLETPMGKVSVPIPLRAFPPSPALLRQRFEATHEDATDIEGALAWTYVVDVGAPAAAQDTLHLEVTFNEPPAADAHARAMAPEAAADTRPPPAHLLEALARFEAEYPAIEPKLALVEQAAFEGGDGDHARRWLAHMLELVAGAAGTWADWRGDSGPAAADALGDGVGPPQHTWRYAITIPDETRPDRIVVTRPADTAAHWPAIDGAQPSAEDPDRATYTLERRRADTLELAWPRLDALARQSAGTAAYVERNADFGGRAATDAFVYVTPTVKLPSALVPLLEIGATVPRHPGASLEAALASLYAEILARAASSAGNGILEQHIGYEYALGEGEHALVGRVPVFLANAQLSTAGAPPEHFDSPSEFAKRLAAELARWHARFNPAGDRANVTSTLTVFATITDRRLPLARFERIQFPVPPGEPGWWG